MKRVFSFFLLIVIAYVSSAFVRTYIIQTYYIPTVSMAPALNVNDRVLVLKKLFFSNNIDYGDIIVFYPVDSEPPSNLNILKDSLNVNMIINIETNDPVYIKRVIGKEYDLIRISKNGSLYINDIKQDYQYVNTGNFDSKEWSIPPGEYFVLGDNLLNSIDSRTYGTIDENNIVGRAWLKIYPFNEFRLLND